MDKEIKELMDERDRLLHELDLKFKELGTESKTRMQRCQRRKNN